MRVTYRLIGQGWLPRCLQPVAAGRPGCRARQGKATSALASNTPVEAAPLRVPPVSAAPPSGRARADPASAAELAVLAALQSAVAQVNGVRVASQMQGLRAGLHRGCG